MIRKCSALLLLAMALALAASAVAQDNSGTRAVTGSAQALAAAGQWDEAARRLLAARAECAAGDAGRLCRLLIDFNIGHLHQARSRSEPSLRADLLRASATAYRRVLAEAPAHRATLNNLALVLADLGNMRGLQRLSRQALPSNPSLAAAIMLLIGETHAANSRWGAAYDAYALAARLNPREEAPRLKMVQAYSSLTETEQTAERVRQFVTDLRRWEESFPLVAQEGYRTIVQQRHGNAPDEAEEALSHWVRLAAGQRTLSAASIEDTFNTVSFPPLAELQGLVEWLEKEEQERFTEVQDIETALITPPYLADLRFWSAQEQRRNVLGLAALALGRTSVVDRNPGQAERQWVLGLALSPPIEEYISGNLQEEDFLPLELITELAWLQFRYPALDPEERKFDYFIDLLFSGKQEAYRASDLRAIQRHHIVLGEIFAAKGAWRSDGIRNAIFQLSNAIWTADRRAEEEGFYQPLPGVKERLSEGYVLTGERDLAVATMIDAAQGYLDTDALNRAGTMLDRASSLSDSERIPALKHLLSLRRSVQGALDGGQATELASRRIEEETTGLVVPPDFLARQRFKLLADLAEARSRSASPEVARAEARSALSAARQVNTLIGTADILRLERAAASAANEAGAVATVGIGEIYERDSGLADWHVTLPSMDRSLPTTLEEGVRN